MVYGPFFPGLSYPFTGPCTGPCTRRVPRTWFCPVFHGARQLPFTTAVGHFFPVSTYSPFTPPCKGPCTRRVPRTWFCPVFHGARQLPSTTAVGHFFPVSTYVPSTSFCPVFNVARAAPSQTGVRQKNSRVTVTAVFGPCTGPCTRTCIVRRFAQFSMSHVQLLHGTVRFWSVHGSMYTYVPSTSFCPVFNVARAAPSQTGVRPKSSRVMVPA